jgi:hypothetical protein
MSEGMIPENMAFLVNQSDHFRKVLGLCSNRKKGGFDLMTLQDGQKIGGSGRIRPIIKSQSDPLISGIAPANGVDEKIKF